MHNANAGHSVPTGDPERYLELHTVVTSPDGTVLADDTEVVRARFEWYPSPKLLADNRLTAGEQRTHTVAVDVGDHPELTAAVTLDKFRIDEHALAFHHLEGKVVAGRRSTEIEVTATTE